MLPYKDKEPQKLLPNLLVLSEEYKTNFDQYLKNINLENATILFEDNILELKQLCLNKKFQQISKILLQLMIILEYNFTDNTYVLKLIDLIDQSSFFQILPILIKSENERLKEILLKFFITFSYISGDFMDILIPFFDDSYFNNFFFSETHCSNIILHFYIEIGLLSEYSDEFIQNTITSHFLDATLQLFPVSNLQCQIQILNFLNKMTQNCSEIITFSIYCDNFKSFTSYFKIYLSELFESVNNADYFCEMQISLLIFDIFQNIFYIFNHIYLSENISQLVIMMIIKFDLNEQFFIDIFPSAFETFILGFDIIVEAKVFNADFIIQFFIIIFHFLDRIQFSEKVKIMAVFFKKLLLFKKESFFLFKDILSDYIDSEIDFGDEINDFLNQFLLNQES